MTWTPVKPSRHTDLLLKFVIIVSRSLIVKYSDFSTSFVHVIHCFYLLNLSEALLIFSSSFPSSFLSWNSQSALQKTVPHSRTTSFGFVSTLNLDPVCLHWYGFWCKTVFYFTVFQLFIAEVYSKNTLTLYER